MNSRGASRLWRDRSRRSATSPAIASACCRSIRIATSNISSQWPGAGSSSCRSTRASPRRKSPSGSRIPGCSGLFIDDAFLPALGDFRSHAPDLRHIVRVGGGGAPPGILAFEDLVAKGAPIADAGRRDDDLAGIFYTGGTTGRSKGVMLSHRNILANALNCAAEFEFDQNTVFLHAAPMFHLADGAATFLATAAGGKHVFAPRFEPGLFLETVARFRVTAALCVPTMINLIIYNPNVTHTDTSSLTTMFYGASPMPKSVIRRALEVLPHTRFVQAYGQSEAARA